MGTNFYARIIPTKKKKWELITLIEENKFTKILDMVDEMYRSTDDYKWYGGEIHLGKRSGGWKFLWNTNHWRINEGSYDLKQMKYIDNWVVKKYYDLTKKSISEFLHQPNIMIVDEYYSDDVGNNGDPDPEESHVWTADQFLKMASDCDKPRDDGTPKLDDELYMKKYNEGGCYLYETDTTRLLRDLGYKLGTTHDFYSDGLRFSTSTQFC